jgi:PAS domain S-box-containing protein
VEEDRIDPDRLRERLAACEEELGKARESARILEHIVVGVKDFAVIVLSPDGRVSLWNEGATRLLGYDTKDIMGQSARILFTPEDQAGGRPEKELAEAAEVGRASDECWMLRKNGSRFWAEGVTNGVRSPTGVHEGFVKILRDNTIRKGLEDELRRLNTSLDERVRQRTEELEDALKEMSAFSYSIAHDLLAPLRAMSGFAHLLAEEFPQEPGSTGKEYTDRITAGAAQMQAMISDLLEYSRLSRTEVLCSVLDPAEIAQGVIDRLAPEIRERNAQVTVVRPLPLVLAHDVTLTQVFNNLVSNAIKFVAPGVAPQVRVGGEETPDGVRLWVEDNGIGIAPEHQERIFGIFERLNSAGDYPGTGIGLAIVKRAVERMRGKTGVVSRPGGGSRFWIQLRRPALPSGGNR